MMEFDSTTIFPFSGRNASVYYIIDGKKILYPTNNGNLYYEQIIGLVKKYLLEKGFCEELKSFYYKKSNYGDKSMDLIDFERRNR